MALTDRWGEERVMINGPDSTSMYDAPITDALITKAKLRFITVGKKNKNQSRLIVYSKD